MPLVPLRWSQQRPLQDPIVWDILWPCFETLSIPPLPEHKVFRNFVVPPWHMLAVPRHNMPQNPAFWLKRGKEAICPAPIPTLERRRSAIALTLADQEAF